MKILQDLMYLFEELISFNESYYKQNQYAYLMDSEIENFISRHSITERDFYMKFPRVWTYTDYCNGYKAHGISWSIEKY